MNSFIMFVEEDFEKDYEIDNYKEKQEKKDLQTLEVFNQIGLMYLNKNNLDEEIKIQNRNGRSLQSINKELSMYLQYVSEMKDILQDLINKNIKGSLNI